MIDTTIFSRHQKSDAATKQSLDAFTRKDSLVIVRSPPGGGKTGIVLRAAQQGLRHGERVMIGAQSQEQALDLVRSFCLLFPDDPITFLSSRGKIEESNVALSGFLKITVTCDNQRVANGPIIAVANTNKWGFVRDENIAFDVCIIDEAYQMQASLFDRIAGLAQRYFLVGDPGQIQPIVRSDIRAYTTKLDAPHLPAPDVLLERWNTATVIHLPISRRLVQDTVSIIQDIFYPSLLFEGMESANERQFFYTNVVDSFLGNALCLSIQSGNSIVGVRLPKTPFVSVTDPRMVSTMQDILQYILQQELSINGIRRPIVAKDIGIVCARTAQVAALQSSLPEGVYIETANRMQGLERPFIFCWHPLSGVDAPDDFHLEIGRLCVSLSRHQVSCIVFYEHSIEKRLEQVVHLGERKLSPSLEKEDQSFQSFLAQEQLLEVLRKREIA